MSLFYLWAWVAWRWAAPLWSSVMSEWQTRVRRQEREQRLFQSAPRGLALSKRGPEYVGVISVIVSELEFSDVQMQILFADLMEGANDAALQDRPEAFDGLRVNSADDVLMRSVVW